jgi:shikimate kinase
MGAGKSSVGECLARELGYRFVDLDHEIEQEAGRDVASIIRDDGEGAFRRLEAAALRRVSALSDAVIACGGGTLSLAENRDLVARTGFSIWLDAPLDVMLERCRGGTHRPLLGERARMEALLASRISAYRQADMGVDASAERPEALARRIAARLPLPG